MLRIFLVISLIFLAHFHALGDLITRLPGLETPVNFKQYSGYITVDPANGTRLFYWYVESQSNPSTDPLVLWLNGGPGCSSLVGFLGELGPFYVKPNLTLGLNEYSWNKIANMVFLEAPAGVGFSESDHPINYNDEDTTNNMLAFLIRFFALYPNLNSNAFWMTGESYAGHYIPILAAKIRDYNNKRLESGTTIRLKGMMIGDPLTSWTIDKGSAVDYTYYHQLISRNTYIALRRYCNYTFSDPPAAKSSINIEKCKIYEEKETKEMGAIDPLDIYADVCLQKKHERERVSRGIFDHLKLKKRQDAHVQSPYNPCQGNFIRRYLNSPNVQKAIHVESTKWLDCSTTVEDTYSKSDVQASMLPVYNDVLFKMGLKILIYTGDVDSLATGTGTRNCLKFLKTKLIRPWKPWMDSNGQVGGYMEVYDKLTYATVRFAGHQVPSYQPLRAFDLFSRFLRA